MYKNYIGILNCLLFFNCVGMQPAINQSNNISGRVRLFNQKRREIERLQYPVLYSILSMLGIKK